MWILIARTVERLSEIDSSVARSDMLRSFGNQFLTVIDAASESALTIPPSVSVLAMSMRGGTDRASDLSVFDGVVAVAEDMEGAGVLQLAFSMLAHLRLTWPSVDRRRYGKALAMQGRIAREIGDLQQATELYCQVADMAGDATLADVASQAAHGLGGIALARGNLPDARRQYELALQFAKESGARQLEGRAHGGLLIVAAKEGNHDSAVQHGWAAFQRTFEDRNSQAELLGNLGGLLRECGHYSASLACYSLAIQWTDADRIRLPALGGAALAAALSGKVKHVQNLARRIELEVAKGAQPFNAAQALLDLAYAYAALRNPKANLLAAQAETISRSHNYFELEHLARELQTRNQSSVQQTSRAPLSLSESTMRVLDSMATLADENASINALAGTTE